MFLVLQLYFQTQVLSPLRYNIHAYVDALTYMHRHCLHCIPIATTVIGY